MINSLINSIDPKIKRDLLFYFSRLLNRPLVSPDYLMLSITNYCNLRCVMCGVPNLAIDKPELTLTEIKNIINQAKEIFGFVKVVLTGGEPFLRRDIFDIIKHIHDNNLEVDINTNAILIDEYTAEKISEYGVYALSISLDGASEEINDFIRGNSVYIKVLKAIKTLNDIKKRKNLYQPYINLIYTIMDTNVEEIKDFIDLAIELNCNSISFQPVVCDNTKVAMQGDNPLFVLPERLSLLSKLEEEFQYIEKKVDIYYPSIAQISGYFMQGLNKKRWKCFAGYNRISISSLGEVYTCQQDIGNIRKASLKDVWYSREANCFRKTIKKCKKNCLQLCYARPDSESLLKILQRLVKDRINKWKI